MSLIIGLIVGLIVFFLIKTQATPLSLLTRTDTVHTNLGETQDQPREGRWGFGAGLGRTVCSAAGTRSDAALRRAGAGLDSTGKTETVAPEPVATLVMVTKSLRSVSLTISLSCSHLRPKQ